MFFGVMYELGMARPVMYRLRFFEIFFDFCHSGRGRLSKYIRR